MPKSQSSSYSSATMIISTLVSLLCATLAGTGAAADIAPTSSLLSKMDLDESMRLHGMLAQLSDESRSRRSKHTAADASSPSSEEDVLNTRRLASCSDKLDKCRAKLESCEDEVAQPTFLFTQMAETCKLKRKVNNKGDVTYEWSSKDMDDDTYVFSDRPYQIAFTMPTEGFFHGFDEMFNKDNGGKPNGAITFRHKNTKNFEGPLISVFVEAAYKTNAGKFIYELSQSKEQEAVNALEDFFEDGDGEDDGVVEYEMCSLFIDNTDFCEECKLCETNENPTLDCDDRLDWHVKACKDSCDAVDEEVPDET